MIIFHTHYAMQTEQSNQTTIQSFGFILVDGADGGYAWTPNTVTITLWFDGTGYQCEFVRPCCGASVHECTASSWITLPNEDNTFEFKMIIENDHYDAVIIDKVFVNTDENK